LLCCVLLVFWKTAATMPTETRSTKDAITYNNKLLCLHPERSAHRRTSSGCAHHRRTPSKGCATSGLDASQRYRRCYSDASKPRPLLRGSVHGFVSFALVLALVVLGTRMPRMSFALFLKLCTYASSATFHLFPWSISPRHGMKHEMRCFVADICAVPLAVIGGTLPFIAEAHHGREALLAAAAFLLNAGCVAWQTRGQVGLATPADRSDVPRTIVIALYTTHSILKLGLTSGFCVTWVAMLLALIVSITLADLVSKAHAEEPSAKWAAWHVPGVWSFHEDFHVALLVSDAFWLVLALRVLEM